MCRNLLLGNGINMHFNVSDMTMEDIAFWYIKDLIISSPFYELFLMSHLLKMCVMIYLQIIRN